MKAGREALACLVLLSVSVAQGAGLAYNADFVVLAPDQQLAEDVLAKADVFRKQVSTEWLGAELPPSVGRTVIHVEISDRDDSGLTWAIDSPDRKLHKLWLTTSRERVLGSTLKHEVSHVVMATRFPHRLPAWADEGIAGFADDQIRIDARRRIIRWYADTGNWPDLKEILDAPVILSSEKASYAVAASITEYLVSCAATKRSSFALRLVGKKEGWNAALAQQYGLRSVDDLQRQWQAWLTASHQEASARASHAPRSSINGRSGMTGNPPTRRTDPRSRAAR